MRINKYLASAGLGSRRKVEELVVAKKVTVDGKVMTDLSFDVNPHENVVCVDGEQVKQFSEQLYFALNKPKGCITSVTDDRRKTVMDHIPEQYRRVVVPVGRLDFDSEGLLLFTNDGDFIQSITHPSTQIPKTYVANVEGQLDSRQISELSKGVEIDGVRTLPARVRVIDFVNNVSRVQITITEGRNRQIRKMLEAVGKEVLFLKRTQIGGMRLGGMGRGELKELTKAQALRATMQK